MLYTWGAKDLAWTQGAIIPCAIFGIVACLISLHLATRYAFGQGLRREGLSFLALAVWIMANLVWSVAENCEQRPRLRVLRARAARTMRQHEASDTSPTPPLPRSRLAQPWAVLVRSSCPGCRLQDLRASKPALGRSPLSESCQCNAPAPPQGPLQPVHDQCTERDVRGDCDPSMLRVGGLEQNSIPCHRLQPLACTRLRPQGLWYLILRPLRLFDADLPREKAKDVKPPHLSFYFRTQRASGTANMLGTLPGALLVGIPAAHTPSHARRSSRRATLSSGC